MGLEALIKLLRGGEGEVRSGWTVGSTGEVVSGKGRLCLVLCCSTEDEIGGLDLGEIERKEDVCKTHA